MSAHALPHKHDLRQHNNAVHALCPEKRKLGNRDRPLWERILQGPSDDIMKIFLMDTDEEEVSNDVSAVAPPTLKYFRHTTGKMFI